MGGLQREPQARKGRKKTQTSALAQDGNPHGKELFKAEERLERLEASNCLRGSKVGAGGGGLQIKIGGPQVDIFVK